MWTICFIVIFTLWINVRLVNACPVVRNRIMESFTNCETTLIDNKTHLSFKCIVYALSETQLPYLPIGTFGIIVTTTFKTPISLTTQLTDQSYCLQMTRGIVRRLNPFEDQQLLNKSNKFYINQIMAIPLVSVKQFELSANFNSAEIVGLVNVNSSCIKMINDSSNSSTSADLDVSNCVNRLQVLQGIATPGDGTTSSSINFFDLLNKDVFTIIFRFMDDLWLERFDGTVEKLTLTLSEQFMSFPKEALSMLAKRKVEEIHLIDNLFDEITDNDFPAFPTLKVLNFQGCNLKNIQPLAFQWMTNLLHLNLARNRLTELPEAIKVLKKLETLNVSSNRILNGYFILSTDLLDQMILLKTLDLSNMSLLVLGNGTLVTTNVLPSLLTLNLSRNSLHSFPKQFNNKFLNVQAIDLSNNFIKDESLPIASNWTQLYTLDLSSNEIRDANYTRMFQQFPRLKTLNLAKNKIRVLRPLNLQNNSQHQRHLNLSGNNIHFWNQSMINVTKPNQLTIDLTNNNITEASPQMLNDFSQLNHVYLGLNPFDCSSCLLEPFQRWLNENGTSTDFDVSAFKCAFPKESYGLNVTDVHLDPELCMEKVFNWLINVVVPIAVIIATSIVIGVVVFNYRWHIRYFFHLFQARMATKRNETNPDSDPIYRYDAFVSYCANDQEWVVQQLIPSIENQNPQLHLCIHERDFQIGDSIVNNVIDCIDKSRKSIFILSQDFIQSNWCQWELQMAQHKLLEERKDVLILIMLVELDSKTVPKFLKRLMSTKTYLIWPQSDNAPACKLFWSRLRQSIGPCHCLQKQLIEQQLV
ncbi:hypothetical protein CHUAL_007532 [Chamberlinius hualienensis]